MSWVILEQKPAGPCPSCGTDMQLIAKSKAWCKPCGQVYQKPRRIRQHRRDRNRSPEECGRVLEAARKTSLRDYLIFWLMYKRGLRVGEVVGSHRNGANLPGIQVEDLRESDVWVEGKKGHRDPWPLPAEIMTGLREVAPRKGNVFDIGDETVRRLAKKYARDAGLEDPELFHPHIERHTFGTHVGAVTGGNVYKVRDAMRHSSIASSNPYVEGFENPQEKKKLLEEEFT